MSSQRKETQIDHSYLIYYFFLFVFFMRGHKYTWPQVMSRFLTQSLCNCTRNCYLNWKKDYRMFRRIVVPFEKSGRKFCLHVNPPSQRDHALSYPDNFGLHLIFGRQPSQAWIDRMVGAVLLYLNPRSRAQVPDRSNQFSAFCFVSKYREESNNTTMILLRSGSIKTLNS